MTVEKHYPHVFQPIQVGTLTLKNRLQFSPIVSGHADALTGASNPELVEFVGAQARSGVGLVTIGSSPIDFDRARDFYGCLSVTRDSDVADLSVIAEEVHRYGAKISLELTHAGAISDPSFLQGPAFVPTVIPEFHNVRFTKEIERGEMDEVRDHWAACVRRLREAGFDMAMIHGAHGNLFASFLSSLLNRRTDEYGGSLENRMRFPLEVLEACRAEAGDRFNIELRISGDERVAGGAPLEERIAFLNAASEFIDLVVVSSGLFMDPRAITYMIPSYHLPHLLNVEIAARIKAGIGIPVSVVGGITSIDEAEAVLAAGKADMVAMAKALIADQDLAIKARSGRAAEIRPCLRCLECCRGPHTGAPMRCSVNPQAGREVKYREIPLARTKKRVLVIGGGPAGMTAVRTAAERGHDVTLWEKADRLGGRLYEASALPQKDTFRKYIDWAIAATMRSGARVMLGKEATPEAIEAEAPDAVIVAVGAELLCPPIEGVGLPKVITVVEADLGQKPVGQTVVVVGGGLSGSECAAGLAMQGKKVTVIDILPVEQLCWDLLDLARLALFNLMEDTGVVRMQGSVAAITETGVTITLPDGSAVELPADTVVMACGLRPDTSVVDPLLGVVSESYLVGDCNNVGAIFHANHEAFNVAVEV
ncbi:MAG: FAD-dependent oxidoreductase [Thermoleophilia bacterium]|nr:FAD-dependent oxidoreductase [Thermoleophilia bacterium]